MAEGEFEDLEMEDLENRYPRYDDKNYEELFSDFQELTMKREYSSLDTTDIDSEIKYVESLMEVRSSGQQSTSFTSGDDGKTVTITGPSGSKTTAPGVEFVDVTPRKLPGSIKSMKLEKLNKFKPMYRSDGGIKVSHHKIFKEYVGLLTSFLKYTYNYEGKIPLGSESAKRLIRNIIFIRSGQIKDSSLGLVMTYKDTEVAKVNTQKRLFKVTQLNENTDNYKEFKTTLDRLVSETGQIIEGVADETGVSKDRVIGEINNDDRLEFGMTDSVFLENFRVTPSNAQNADKVYLTKSLELIRKKFSDGREGSAEQPTTSGDVDSSDLPMIETRIERPHIQGLTEGENRELEGVLNPSNSVDPQSRIGDNGAFQIQVDHIQETLNRTFDQRENTDVPEEVIELEERIIALREARDLTLQQRQIEEVRAQQEEDVSRLQRFKEWAKENMLGLSAIAITVAGIITTVVIGARNVIVKGAQATGKFAKALAKLGKELGPVLGQLFNMIAKLVSLGAKGQAWLASNLWVLAIAVAWLIYDYSKERRRKK